MNPVEMGLSRMFTNPETSTKQMSRALVLAKPFISHEKHQRLRHLMEVHPYNKGNNWQDYGLDISHAMLTSDALIKTGFIPAPTAGRKTLIFSAASNASLMEHIMQKSLGDEYRVIAGDLANVKRLSKSESPIRADDMFLPFPENSLDAVIDYMGASWYEANEDIAKKGKTHHIDELYREYRRVLRPGRPLIVEQFTANMVDKGNNGSCYRGFSYYKEFHVGEVMFRAYFK